MLLLRMLTILLTAIDVQVDLLDGQSHRGTLTAISADALTLTSDGQDISIPLADILGVVRNETDAEAAPAVHGQLMLIDGSELHASVESITAREVSASSGAGSLLIPRAAVRAVRLSTPTPAWDEQWHEYLKRDNQDDLLILKKRDGSGLDFYGGVISATADDKIHFVLDGDTVPVPRSRIYGLVFAASDSTQDSPVAVRLTDGSLILSPGLTTKDDSELVSTSWNQTLTVPLTLIHSLDFSRGRFHYLSDLDPVKETYLGTHPKGSLLEELLQADDILGPEAMGLWKMHRDQIPMGPVGPLPLTLRGRVYRKGLWLFPHCRIDYALDGRYTALQSVVGVDDEVAFNSSDPEHPGKVELTILADGDEAWHQLIEAPADPVKLNLDVSGVRTLSIIVDFGDDSSACDFLDLADARLLLVP